jgi:S-adenosylmethionine:tRNA ribosyltransferase-isomerase
MGSGAQAARDLTLADFDYELPAELIAQQPPAERGASRLLEVDGERLLDRRFDEVVARFAPGDLLVLNDTRVIKARLFGRKASGGKVELLVERLLPSQRALALLRTSHTARPGTPLLFGTADTPVHATVLGRRDDFFELEFDADPAALLQEHGHVPLPPYITHSDSAHDEQRYQTVYAQAPGAVAAPTAGLHFTDTLLARLRGAGVTLATVTLHVGAGTFQPVRVERIAEHRMHIEQFEIPEATAAAINDARRAGRRITAVGTTSLRALESAAAADGQVRAGAAQTQLFITPGYRFKLVDRLITNFHLPRSTLLMLVSAFAGFDTIRAAYAHAIAQRYRFFSYGDAMLLSRDDGRQ